MFPFSLLWLNRLASLLILVCFKPLQSKTAQCTVTASHKLAWVKRLNLHSDLETHKADTYLSFQKQELTTVLLILMGMLVQYEHAPGCFSFINLDGEESAGFWADWCPGILWMATKENYFIFLKLPYKLLI